jgi:hypothetical protein
LSYARLLFGAYASLPKIVAIAAMVPKKLYFGTLTFKEEAEA